MPVAASVTGYVGSPGGKKVIPAVSILLIMSGIVLILVGLFGSRTTTTPVAVATAPGQLEGAMGVAKAYLLGTKPHSYKGFNAKTAEPAASKFSWTTGGPASPGQISIRLSGRTGIVLVSKDIATGVIYCIADTNGDSSVSKGMGDVKTPADCSGGWETP